MERKTEHFFDGDKLNVGKVVTQLQQHPDKMHDIIEFVAHKVKLFTEFHTKKAHLKEDYEDAVKDLYAEYMAEEDEDSD